MSIPLSSVAFIVDGVLITIAMKVVGLRERELFRIGKIHEDPGWFIDLRTNQFKYIYRLLTYSRRDIDDNVLLIGSYVARLGWLAGFLLAIASTVRPHL